VGSGATRETGRGIRPLEESTARPEARDRSPPARVWGPPASPRSNPAPGASLERTGWDAPKSGGDVCREAHGPCTPCKQSQDDVGTTAVLGRSLPFPGMGAPTVDPFSPSPLSQQATALSPFFFSILLSGIRSDFFRPRSTFKGLWEGKESGKIAEVKPATCCRANEQGDGTHQRIPPACPPAEPGSSALPHSTHAPTPSSQAARSLETAAPPRPGFLGLQQGKAPKPYPKDFSLRDGKHQGSSAWCPPTPPPAPPAPGDRRGAAAQPLHGCCWPGGSSAGAPSPPRGVTTEGWAAARNSPGPRGGKRRRGEGRC